MPPPTGRAGIARRRSHPAPKITRLLLLAALLLTACHHTLSEQDVPVAGMVPALQLSMFDVTANKPITAADFSGKIILLYFGYTNCPDVCPATLYNVDRILHRLGPNAKAITFLFATVDPERDSPATLAQYTALFGPQIHGLRGTPDQLYSLARRYRVVFSVTKPTAATPYQVTHSSAIYVFSQTGAAQFLIAGLDTPTPDIPGITTDLQSLINANPAKSFLARIKNLIAAS